MAFEIPVFTSRNVGDGNPFSIKDGKYAFIGIFANSFKSRGKYYMGYNLVFASVDDNGNPLSVFAKATGVLSDNPKVTNESKPIANNGTVIEKVAALRTANGNVNTNLFWIVNVAKEIGGKVFSLKNTYYTTALRKTGSVFTMDFVNNAVPLNLGNNAIRETLMQLAKPMVDAETLKIETLKAKGEISEDDKPNFKAAFILFDPNESYTAKEVK